MKTTDTTAIDYKARLIQVIDSDFFTDAHAEATYKLINMFASDHLSKNDILEFMNIDKNGKIDTATPIDYVRRVQEILPSFNTMFNVYDYRTANFGEFMNIAEAFILHLQKTYNSDYNSPDSLKTYDPVKLVNKVIIYAFNFEYQFYKNIDWTTNQQHMENKWHDANFNTADNTALGFIKFFTYLDNTNRAKLINYINETFKG